MEKTIEITCYCNLDEKIAIISHTANWCTPCNNIKPVFTSLMNYWKKNVIYSNHYTLSQYREKYSNKIPYFEVTTERGVLLEGVQSSSPEVVTALLSKYCQIQT